MAERVLTMETSIRRLVPGSILFPAPFYTEYLSKEHYAVSLEPQPDGIRITLKREALDPHVSKGFTIELNPPYFQPAEDYGLYLDETLLGLIELHREDWTNRLRITEFWVREDRRRLGLGSELLRFALRRARELQCRALVLETQSCNVGAIDCYRKFGFRFIGLDAIHYSDADIANHEVRLEMGWVLKEHENVE